MKRFIKWLGSKFSPQKDAREPDLRQTGAHLRNTGRFQPDPKARPRQAVPKRQPEFVDIDPHIVGRIEDGGPGKNVLKIDADGEANVMLQAVGRYYMPWDRVAEPKAPPMAIEVEYDRTELAKNDTVKAHVHVAYRDDMNQVQTWRQSVRLEVEDNPRPAGQPNDPEEGKQTMPPTFWQTVLRGLRGFLGFGS